MLITISRQFGAGGSEVAERVAAALGWRLVDNDLVEQVARRAGLPPEEVAEREERVPRFTERLARTLAAGTPEVFPLVGEGRVVPRCREHELVKITEAVVAEIAAEGRVVVVGRATAAVLARQRDALHVRLVAPRAFRADNAARRLGITQAQACAMMDETDRMRARYHREYYHRDWNDPLLYHMVINTGMVGIARAAEMVERAGR
ncbi:MAG TPA: cytidylate kinase-like family protein [Gemmatimonadales bacterium]|jgi:cytidylate kinase|nr:cytidylate kinase-like family protein [Gemmatimonadales bacterium]